MQKALLSALVLALAACGEPLGVDGGRVQFTITGGDLAAPAGVSSAPSATGDWDGDWDGERNPYFQSANVTFSSILARNVDGVLVNTDMDLPTTVDIVRLEEGRRTVTLPDGNLPAGTYDQIVVVMTQVEAVTRDGTTITITPPGGGWTAIVPVCPFDVAGDATALVGLVLPVRSAFAFSDGRFRFVPRFRSRVRCEPPPPEPETNTDATTG